MINLKNNQVNPDDQNSLESSDLFDLEGSAETNQPKKANKRHHANEGGDGGQ